MNFVESVGEKFADTIITMLRGLTVSELSVLMDESDQAPVPISTARKARLGATVTMKALKTAKGPKPGRLARRSPEDIAKAVDKVVALVKKAGKDGLRAENIRVQGEFDVREMPRILAEACDARRLTWKGQKRATTYYVGRAK